MEPEFKHAQAPAPDLLCHPVQESLSGSPGPVAVGQLGTAGADGVPVLLLPGNWCLCGRCSTCETWPFSFSLHTIHHDAHTVLGAVPLLCSEGN